MAAKTRNEDPDSGTKILVIRGGAIGDFILTIPAIQLLRAQLPGAHIEILGYPAVTALAKESGIADAVRSIEYAGLANFFNPSTVLDPDLMEYFAGFNLVVSYLFDPDGFFIGNLERSGVKSCLACSHRVDEKGEHAAVQLAGPLGQIALFLEEPAPSLRFPASLREEAARLAGSSVSGNAPIALHPGSGSPRKNWPVENWIALARRLHESQPSRPFILVSGEADEANAQPLLDDWTARGIAFFHAHALALPVLGAILSRCALFLGHDSGISHLAAAAGAPCVLLFGPTNPAVWAPRNPHVTVIEAPDGDLSSGPPGEEVAARAAAILE